jgi:hypothetical protein
MVPLPFDRPASGSNSPTKRAWDAPAVTVLSVRATATGWGFHTDSSWISHTKSTVEPTPPSDGDSTSSDDSFRPMALGRAWEAFFASLRPAAEPR